MWFVKTHTSIPFCNFITNVSLFLFFDNEAIIQWSMTFDLFKHLSKHLFAQMFEIHKLCCTVGINIILQRRKQVTPVKRIRKMYTHVCKVR